MLEKLKAALGIADDEKDGILQWIIDTVSEMVLNYCNIEELPESLENIVVLMCVDKYRAENFGRVKSLLEGDVSVGFSSGYSVSENPAMEFLKGYRTQLDRFRRLGK